MNTYERNLKALEIFHPDLAQKIRLLPSLSNDLELLTAKSGLPTVRKNGCLLHSAYDPRREAAEFIGAFAFKAKNSIFALGFAFGYHIDEFLARELEYSRIFIIEPDAALFQCALRARNLVPLFKNERILFLIGLTPLEVFEYLTNRVLLVMSSKISIMEYPSSVGVDPKYFEELRKKIADAVRMSAANVDTLNYAGRIFIQNAARNLVETVRASGINTLFNMFLSVPAVIVSAGPSLDKNIGFLKEAKGKCLILATDTSFKILLRHHITPDFVLTMDFKEVSRLHFENIECEDVPMLFDMESAPASLKAYPCARFVTASRKPFAIFLNTIIGNKGFVSKGMSVAHFAFSSAEAFGCDPIIFIGQDLSFSNGFSHAQGTSSRKEISSANNKGEKLIRVKSLLTGEEVLTNDQMYIYLRHFEKLIARSKRMCINATEGGVGINGAVAMNLEDAIRAYCTKEVAIAEIISQARLNAPQPDICKVIKNVDELVLGLDDTGKASLQIMEILEQVFKLSREPAPDVGEISRKFLQLKSPAEKVASAEVILRFIHADLMEHMMQQRREGRFDPACLKDVAVKDLEADLKDDYKFQKAVYDGVTFLKGCLEKSLDELKALSVCLEGVS